MNTKESSEKDQKSLKRSRGSSSTKSSEESKRPKKVSKSDETSSEHEKSKSSKTSDKTAPEKKSNAKTIEKKQKTNSKESKGSSASSSSEAAKITKDKTINGGFGWKSTKPLPSRKANGVLVFDDFTDLQPNRTPKEILQAGSFGGTYFRPIYSSVTKEKYGSEAWEELPKDWLEGLSIKRQVASTTYDEKVNKYKAKCGGSLQMWEESGWIQPQDPYGWFQWYCRFYQGRRTDDDARQVSRWWNCASVNGRWKNNLITKVFKSGTKFDNPNVSPVIRQTLLHWGYELTEEDYKQRVKKIANKV